MHPIADKDKIRVSFKYKERYDNRKLFKSRGIAGKPHLGIDFAPKKDYKKIPLFIIAPVNGAIVAARYHKQYGWMIAIESDEYGAAYLHILAHLDRISKHIGKVGEFYNKSGKRIIYPNKRVKKGEILGIMGSSGMSTARHLHYQVEMQIPGKPYKTKRYNRKTKKYDRVWRTATHYWLPDTWWRPVSPKPYLT